MEQGTSNGTADGKKRFPVLTALCAGCFALVAVINLIGGEMMAAGLFGLTAFLWVMNTVSQWKKAKRGNQHGV